MNNDSTYLRNILLRTTDLHDYFTSKSVFIVGVTGFIGGWFLRYFRHLRAQGIDVKVSGGSYRNLVDDPDIYPLDVLNLRTYPDPLLEADYVINCAGSAGGGELLVHSHGPGFLALDLAIRGRNGAKLLHFSSGAIDYGTPYGEAKKTAESILVNFNDVQIVRLFAVVGPHMDWRSHFAIPRFLNLAMSKQPLEVAPGVTRSFAHICDVLVQALHVMIRGDGSPYEIGSNDVITMEEAARLISDDVRIVEKEYPTTSAAKHYSADLTRVKNHFNISLDWDSKSSILDTRNWYLKNQ